MNANTIILIATIGGLIVQAVTVLGVFWRGGQMAGEVKGVQGRMIAQMDALERRMFEQLNALEARVMARLDALSARIDQMSAR